MLKKKTRVPDQGATRQEAIAGLALPGGPQDMQEAEVVATAHADLGLGVVQTDLHLIPLTLNIGIKSMTLIWDKAILLICMCAFCFNIFFLSVHFYCDHYLQQ